MKVTEVVHQDIDIEKLIAEITEHLHRIHVRFTKDARYALKIDVEKQPTREDYFRGNPLYILALQGIVITVSLEHFPNIGYKFGVTDSQIYEYEGILNQGIQAAEKAHTNIIRDLLFTISKDAEQESNQ